MLAQGFMKKFRKSMKHGLLILLLILLFPIFLFFNSHTQYPTYDIVVVGSDPEGISSAIAATRLGKKVLIIDSRSEVGGLYTSGMLCMLDLNYAEANSTKIVNEGIFAEFYRNIGDDGAIDIKETKKYFMDLIHQNNITLILNASDFRPILLDKKAVGLSFDKDGKTFSIACDMLIDASRDAQIARLAGVPYTLGREDLGMKDCHAASTLVFSVKGVDWERVKEYLNTDDSMYTGATSKVAWGYEEMLNYRPSSLDVQLRALNLALQEDGSVVINALQIFEGDLLAPNYENYIREKGKAELKEIVPYLQKNAPGFENASLYKVADELYIREGVHIIGEDRLTGEDIFANKDYINKIAYGSYPLDLQSTKRDRTGGTILSGRNLYTIPLGVTIPKGIDNLFVVGRSASYDSIAHSSARTVPVGIAVAQAAGVTAAYCIDNHLTPRMANRDTNHFGEIRKLLENARVELNTPLPSNEEGNEWYWRYIKRLRSGALLSKEYNYTNDYRIGEPAQNGIVHRILKLTEANSNIPTPKLPIEPHDNLVTEDWLLKVVNHLLSSNYPSFKQLYKDEIIDTTTFRELSKTNTINNEHVYAIMDQVLYELRTRNNMHIPSLDKIIRYDR